MQFEALSACGDVKRSYVVCMWCSIVKRKTWVSICVILSCIQWNPHKGQARSQGFELGGSDFGHTQNHTQYHTPLIVCFDFILDDKELMEESVMSDDYVELLVSIL